MKFSEWYRGSVRVKLRKCEKVDWGEKCHYTSDIPFEWLHCCFISILFYIEKKWLLMRNLAIVWKISVLQYYCWKYRNTRKYLNFIKFQLIWKVLKHFTRLKQRVALRKLFSLSLPRIPPDKILLRLCNKHFLREIYRNIHTFAFKVLQESSSWAWGNGAVKMFFLTPNRSIFAGKSLSQENFLAVLWEHIIFNFKRVEIRKMSEIFLGETVL